MLGLRRAHELLNSPSGVDDLGKVGLLLWVRCLRFLLRAREQKDGGFDGMRSLRRGCGIIGSSICLCIVLVDSADSLGAWRSATLVLRKA